MFIYLAKNEFIEPIKNIMEEIKTFTLIDIYQDHMVFVNWQEKLWITLNTNDNTKEYKVGKDYDIKMPEKSL
jgi:hypothetical protein